MSVKYVGENSLNKVLQLLKSALEEIPSSGGSGGSTSITWATSSDIDAIIAGTYQADDDSDGLIDGEVTEF